MLFIERPIIPRPREIFFNDEAELQRYHRLHLDRLLGHFGLDLDAYHQARPKNQHLDIFDDDPEYQALRTSGTISTKPKEFRYCKRLYYAIEHYHILRLLYFNRIAIPPRRRGCFIVLANRGKDRAIGLNGPILMPSLERRDVWRAVYDSTRPSRPFWDHMIDEIRKLSPIALYCRPSDFVYASEFLKGKAFDFPVIFSQETLYPHVREAASKYFPKVIDKMRCWDGGLSFFECVYGRKHINDELSIVEIVDGLIVSTDIYNYSQLFLRYHNGDDGTIDTGQCRCGIWGRYFSEFKGKRVECLITSDGRTIPGAVVVNTMLSVGYRTGANCDYRVEQKPDRSIDILVNKQLKLEALAGIRGAIHQLVNGSGPAGIEINVRLEKNLYRPDGLNKVLVVQTQANRP